MEPEKQSGAPSPAPTGRRERRQIVVDAAGLELRAAGDDAAKLPTIRGYVVVWEAISEDLGGFRERFRKGAFARALPTADVRALGDHLPYRILGRSKAGTLRLREDDKGLYVEIDPPNTTIGRDAVENLRLGNVDGMSVGFIAEIDEWDWSSTSPLRTVIQADIFDVSLVTYPAYPDTEASVRSTDTAAALRSLEAARQKHHATPRRDAARQRLASLK